MTRRPGSLTTHRIPALGSWRRSLLDGRATICILSPISGSLRLTGSFLIVTAELLVWMLDFDLVKLRRSVFSTRVLTIVTKPALRTLVRQCISVSTIPVGISVIRLRSIRWTPAFGRTLVLYDEWTPGLHRRMFLTSGGRKIG